MQSTIKRFGTAFNVENRGRYCIAKVLDGLHVTESEPLVMTDVLRWAQWHLGEFAEDTVELGECMASLQRSGYGSLEGINVRIIPMGG